MAPTFKLGDDVMNFGILARVVGFFKTADGKPSNYDGHPILRSLSADWTRVYGDKWLADPAKLTLV